MYWNWLFYFNESGDLVAGWRIVWADWALHLSQVNAFAHQPFVYVLNHNPIYADHPIAYPFVTNWVSSLLVFLGFNVVSAFVLPSIVFSVFLLLALYLFGTVVTRNAPATLLGICLFFLSGGLEFYYYFSDVAKDFSLQTLLFPPEHYTFLEREGFYWKSVILASLIPQRALLLGMPWMLFALTYLFSQYRKGFVQTPIRSLFVVGMATGLLAIVHPHSLLVLFIISCCLFLTDLQHIRHWLSFAVGVVSTALPWLPFLVGGNPTFSWDFVSGWYANEAFANVNVFWFWLKNWGVFFPLALFALGVLLSSTAGNMGLLLSDQRKERWLFGAFVLLFLLANLIKFQPNLWDNTKILLWSYLGLSFLVAQLLVGWFQRGLTGKVMSGVLVALMTISGGVDLVKSLHITKESHVMLSRDQMELARQLREISQPTDILLTPDAHLHFATTFSGRGVLMGYRGWLWTHNIDYGERERDIRHIYQGTEDAQDLMEKHRVGFVVVDDQAIRDYGAKRSFFEDHFEKVLSSQWGDIYRIHQVPPAA